MIIDMFTDLSWAQHSPNLLLFIFIRYADFQYCEYLVQNCEEWVVQLSVCRCDRSHANFSIDNGLK